MRPLLLLAPALLGYIMSTGALLKRVAQQRDAVPTSTLRLDGQAEVAPVVARDLAAAMGLAWHSGDLLLSARLTVVFPRRCRLELWSPDAPGKTLVAVSDEGKRKHDGPGIAALPALGVAVETLCETLGLRSTDDGATREALVTELRHLGVELKSTTLGRFAGKIAFVVGGRDAESPQLWVYKETFQPARVRLREGDSAWDVRFLDYEGHATPDFFPRIVEVARGVEPHRKAVWLTSQLKPELKDVKF